MLGLTTIPFIPTADGMKILLLLSQGFTQSEIAIEFKIEYPAMRQRITQLKINMGAASNEQLMYEYDKYKERHK